MCELHKRWESLQGMSLLLHPTHSSMTLTCSSEYKRMMGPSRPIVFALTSSADPGRMRQIITPLASVSDQRRGPKKAQGGTNYPRASPSDGRDDTVYYPLTRQHSTYPSSGGRETLPSCLCTPIPSIEQSHSHLITHGIPTPALFNALLPVDPFAFSESHHSLSQSLSANPISLGGSDLGNLVEIARNPPTLASSTLTLSIQESILIDFFLREVPDLLPFSELFPSICTEIWAISLTHYPLTQSILALSNWISVRQSEIISTDDVRYLQNALDGVQENISLGTVNEGTIAAVYLLALLRMLSGDYKGARKQLEEMFGLCRVYRLRPTSDGIHSSNYYPIVMLLWRMAIRMEYHVAFYDVKQGPPVFCLANSSIQDEDMAWVEQIIDKNIPDGIYWALASFALDDMMTRAGDLSHKFLENYDTDRTFQVQILIAEHLDWKHRPVISQFSNVTLALSLATSIEPHLIHTNYEANLLDSPPLPILKKLYATLMIRHCMIGIYLSLLSDPSPGTLSSERLQYAITICHYFISLFGDQPYSSDDASLRPVDSCLGLVFAGLTFREEKCANGLAFCVQTLSEIARKTGFDVLLNAEELLRNT